MLLQTNSYIVPKERRAEHARLIRRFRQALARIGCDQFEVYEQVGANWSPGGANGRYVQIMRFRDRQHQQAVQAAEREDHGAQHIIAEFCELINFPYQQQHGYFATGFYTSVLPVGPRQGVGYEHPPIEQVAQEYAPEEEAELAAEEQEEAQGEWDEQTEETEQASSPAQQEEEAAIAGEYLEETAHPELPASELEDEALADEESAALEPIVPSEIAGNLASIPASDVETSGGLELSPEDAESALLEEQAPPIAPEGVIAEAFLDSLSEEDLPEGELGTLNLTPVAGESSSEEAEFAEAPIAPTPPVDEAVEELVRTDAFSPATESSSAEADLEPLAADEFELSETELAELSPAEAETIAAAQGQTPLAPAVDEHAFKSDIAPAAPLGAETTAETSADLHRDALGDMGLDFIEEQPAGAPASELQPAELDDMGLQFDDFEPEEAGTEEASAFSAPASTSPQPSAMQAPAETEDESVFGDLDVLESPAAPTAHDGGHADVALDDEESFLADLNSHQPAAAPVTAGSLPAEGTLPDEFDLEELESSEPSPTPAVGTEFSSDASADDSLFDDLKIAESATAPIAESHLPPDAALADEFELDEGLIFDDDDLPTESAMPQASTEPSEPSLTASHDAGHGQVTHVPEIPEFDPLLEDANLLASAPISENGQGATPQNSDASGEVDADLLEFDEFLRQLDSEQGHRSK